MCILPSVSNGQQSNMTGGTMNTNTINDLARFNPPHALEGWAAGYRANGEDAKAAECEAALELQARWRAELTEPDSHDDKLISEAADQAGRLIIRYLPKGADRRE